MKRKIRCHPLPMPPVFAWGDSTVNWSRAADDYMNVVSYNRMCELLQRRRNRR